MDMNLNGKNTRPGFLLNGKKNYLNASFEVINNSNFLEWLK